MKFFLLFFTFYFFTFSCISQSDSTSRDDINNLMKKIIKENIKDGVFLYKGENVYVSKGISGRFYLYGYDSGLQFNSVVGTFIYVRWKQGRGLYLTKNILGKLKTAFSTIKNYFSLQKSDIDKNIVFNESSTVEYIHDENNDFIIAYTTPKASLRSLD